MKKYILLVTLLLCTVLVITGCGKSSKDTSSDKKDNKQKEANDDKTKDIKNIEDVLDMDLEDIIDVAEDLDDNYDDSDKKIMKKSDIKSLSDYSEYWSSCYAFNEEAINAYDGMPLLELITPSLVFVTTVQYDLLNLDNVDGKFEGNLMLAGFPATMEKKGNIITFGYKDTREEDGFSPNMKAGDIEAAAGNCDLSKGDLFNEDYTEREGAIVDRTVTEYSIEDDGSISFLYYYGELYDFRMNESPRTTYVYVRCGKDIYEFITAESSIGPEFNYKNIEDNMNKEKAIKLFEESGATIVHDGGIVDGVFGYK